MSSLFLMMILIAVCLNEISTNLLFQWECQEWRFTAVERMPLIPQMNRFLWRRVLAERFLSSYNMFLPFTYPPPPLLSLFVQNVILLWPWLLNFSCDCGRWRVKCCKLSTLWLTSLVCGHIFFPVMIKITRHWAAIEAFTHTVADVFTRWSRRNVCMSLGDISQILLYIY